MQTNRRPILSSTKVRGGEKEGGRREGGERGRGRRERGRVWAQINSPERRIIVFGFRRGGAERYEKLKGCQLV